MKNFIPFNNSLPRINPVFRFAMMAMVWIGVSLTAYSQTVLISPTGDGGFQNGTTFAANGWSNDNDAATNRWFIGTVPPGFTGNSAFVSNDNGVSWNYTNSAVSVVHFWRDITFPAGETNIQLSFNWQALGETSSWDALMVSFAPTTYTPVAGTTSLGTGVLAAPAVTFVQLWNAGSVQTFSAALPSTLIGNCSSAVTLRLIFTWKNDGSGSSPPPAAIDNISLTSQTPGAPMAGTYTVGPAGNYTTLTAAVNDVNVRGVSAPVFLDMLPAYTSGAETFPITMGPNLSCNNAPTSVNTVTIRPQAGAPVLSVIGGNAGPTFDFNGANWWRIDGRPGSAGTSKNLIISNTNIAGQAIRFINDASNNIVRFCDIQGVNNSTAGGVILFSTTTGTTGNDFNLIENNDIHDGATTPTNCILSSGTATTINHFNSNNTIQNNNIFNFFNAAAVSLGALITTGSTEWTISGNSFYQTTSRALGAFQFGAINLPLTTSNYHLVSGNFIGGTAPLCGGGPMTLTGAGNLRAINATVGPGTTVVANNTIQNINLTTSNATGFNGALMLGQGAFDINANLIGSVTSNNSIVVTTSGTTFIFDGIILGGTSPTNIANITNNNIGGISLTVSGAPASPGSIRCISVQGTTTNHNFNITGNTVGSTTVANNITADGNISGSIIGIASFSNAFGQTISNNTVSNLTSTNSGTSNILWGILAQGSTGVGSYNVTGNIVQNITLGTGNVANFSLNGIQVTPNLSTAGSNLIQLNTVRNLLQNNPTAGTSLAGMVIGLPTTNSSNIINRNFLHSFNMTTATLTGSTVGMLLTAGAINVRNNMIRLGIDGSGVATSGFGIVGIQESAGTNNIHFNSIYIGGSGIASGTANTFGFFSSVATGSRNYISNIFYNARSNAGGTGKHYAISVAGTAPNPPGLMSNYNDLFVSGIGGFVGLYNATDQLTLVNWRTATGNDFQSVSGDPKFILPTGTSATVDLHIQAGSPTVVEGGGQPVLGVNDDFDGQPRAALTPTDIGADAGNFLLLDQSGPGIVYTPFTSGCGTGDMTLVGVNITDGTGIPLAGSFIPRIYYRKNAGAWFSRPGVFQSGVATNSNWNFTIVVADMGGIVAGDIIDYYVIAQDNLGQIGSNPGGAVATDVNNVIIHPVTPNTITVLNSLNGTYTVGVGGNFATLTAAVAAYNTGCLLGPVLFSLTDATYPTETFPITINSNAAASSTNTLTIKPAAGNNATITGTSATALIVLNGADWVTIDGSNGNTPNTVCPLSQATRNVTLTNTSTSTVSAVIWLQSVTGGPNGASNNKIINCIISGNGPLQTLCGIGAGSSTIGTASLGTNNNNNQYINNQIRNAQYGIISQGNSATNKNTGNVYNLNLMNQASPTNLSTGGVFITYEDGSIISGNTISNLSQAGSPDVCAILVGFTHSGLTTTTFVGNETTNTTISNNVIGAVLNSGIFSACGIAVAQAAFGTTTISNNMISGVIANATPGDFAAGIALGGGTGTTINVFYNTVWMQGNLPGSVGTAASAALMVTNSTPPSNLNIKNNILVNTQVGNAGSSTKFMAIGLGYSSQLGNYTGLNSDFNDLYAAGPGPGTYMIGITGGVLTGIPRITLANWRTETGRDLNSYNVLPNFVSTTDLHLASTTNQCLDGGAMPISITTDIDCQTRNATNPDIGADEFTNATITLTATENSGLAPNDNIVCAGATVTLTATGGGTYAWSTGGSGAMITVNPTMTTTYTVTITNGTCTDVASITITVIPVPGLTFTAVQPTTCVSTDGSINLTVAPPGTYVYYWADLPGTSNPEDRTGLMVGTYIVTVTNPATNCSSTLSVPLAGPGNCGVCPTIPTLTITPSPVCQNVTFTMTASGLTNMGVTYGIQFVWFPMATGNPYSGGTVLATVPNGSLGNGGTTATATASLATSGTYFIYAILTPVPTDPTCRPSATFTLVVNPTPVVTITVTENSGIAPNDGIICNGASATLTATGGGTYMWSTGANTAIITVSPTTTTTYTVTVTSSAGCTATMSRTITVNSLPTLFNMTGGGSYCAGGPGVHIGLSGSQTGVNYQLRLNGNPVGAPVAGTGAALDFGIFTAPGIYTVVATSTSTGCTATMNGTAVVSSFNCTGVPFDPCTCLNNATTLFNGQFGETIKVNAPNGQTWTVMAVTGLYQVNSPAPPAPPIPITMGTVLTELPGMNMYILNGIHIDSIGYSVTVKNAAGVALTIGNACRYPNPVITSDLSGPFCLSSDIVPLTGIPGDNNIISQVFTVNGQPATEFDPSDGVGQYIIVYSVNGGVPKAFGPLDPGCTQTVSQFVNVFATPTTVACVDDVQISLGDDCTTEITPDMILTQSVGCYDDYLVEMDVTLPLGNGPWVPPLLDASDIGHTYVVRITHLPNGNSCWGYIHVEDKIKPTVVCNDATLTCGTSTEPIYEPQPIGTFTTSTAPNLPIGPGAGVVTNAVIPVSVPPNAVVTDVNVTVSLNHTWVGDLRAELISPNGTTVLLVNALCGAADNWGNVTFDDQALNPIACNPTPPPGIATGTFRPVGLLGVLNGEAANGNWTLRITDQAAGDAGTLLLYSISVGYVVNGPYAPTASDACGEVTLTYTDVVSGDPCEAQTITRTWTATDLSGNTSTCVQVLTILPIDIEDVVAPANFIGQCDDSSSPSNTGWPTVNGVPVTDADNLCNIFVGHWDQPINDCGGGTKIIRRWTVLDWCTQEVVTLIQIIKLADMVPPVLVCPENRTVGTTFWYCYANVSVPKPVATDACSEIASYSLSTDAGVVVSFGNNNYVINQLPLGPHVVVWTVTDECGNSSTCSFTITVVDDVVPVANCDQHTIVALTNDGPMGITLVPATVFNDGSYDNCGPVTFRARRMDSCIDFDWTTEGACIDDDPGGIPPVNSRDRGTVHRPCVPFACCDVGAGPIMVELEVTDAAGNHNYCMVEAEVQDKISPFVECPPDIIVSCDFWFNVQEGTFVDSDGNNNGNLDEDPLSSIFGNMFDAFRYDDDQSVRGDIIINDPHSDIQPQPHFWGIDGWADDNCEVNLQVRVRVVDDCSGGDLPGNAPPGAVKLIERRFSAIDGNDGVAPGTCTQRIWVVDYDPFYITDINCNNANPNDGVIWPCDVLLTNCPEDLGDTGEPTVFDDACSLIGVTYEDQRFDFVDGACFKILREWAVIDWCQYDPLTGEGLWHYTQVIKVHDQEGPEFEACPADPVTLCVEDPGVSLPDNNQAFLGEDNPNASSCSVHLNLHQIVHETCSDIVNYDVKFYPFNGDEFYYLRTTTTVTVDENNNADLSFDTRQNSIQEVRLNGIPYNSAYCGDYHRILWSAEDGCGNLTTCEYLIRLEDCKKPSPVCINGLSTVVMPIGGQVTIWAKDFNASSFDDCTPEAELIYSFSESTYEPSFTYNCNNVPEFGVEFIVNVWVADNGTDDNCNGQISWTERNKDYCTTSLIITDNMHVCDTTFPIIEGLILTEDAKPVELVNVNLEYPSQQHNVTTIQDGLYNFGPQPVDEMSITADRNDNHKNGVNTLDLVMIQKHLLAIQSLSSPYDLIAADANNSGSVSAIDLVEIRKLILGLYNEFPKNKSWRFVDKTFVFPDPKQPWPFDESIDMATLPEMAGSHDFVAVKIGDVNNSVKANAIQIMPRNANGIVHFNTDEQTVIEGSEISVPVRSADFNGITGYQFTLMTKNLIFLGTESGMAEMSDENFGVFNDRLTVSWNKATGQTATSNDVLFTLRFQAVKGGQLSNMLEMNSSVTEAEAYNLYEETKDLKLKFRGAADDADFALYQNVPNPFKGITNIGYEVPAAGTVTLTIFDVTGKVILTKEQLAAKGYNTISVSTKELISTGVLYYRLDADDYTATKKMIIIE